MSYFVISYKVTNSIKNTLCHYKKKKIIRMIHNNIVLNIFIHVQIYNNDI